MNHQSCSINEAFLKKLFKKLSQHRCCEYYKNFKSSYFEEHLRTTASGNNTLKELEAIRETDRFDKSHFQCLKFILKGEE